MFFFIYTCMQVKKEIKSNRMKKNRKTNNAKFEELIMRVDIKHFSYNFLQDFKLMTKVEEYNSQNMIKIIKMRILHLITYGINLKNLIKIKFTWVESQPQSTSNRKCENWVLLLGDVLNVISPTSKSVKRDKEKRKLKYWLVEKDLDSIWEEKKIKYINYKKNKKTKHLLVKISDQNIRFGKQWSVFYLKLSSTFLIYEIEK